MQGIYNYTAEAKHVSRVHTVAAILYLQFTVPLMLTPMFHVSYFYITTFQSTCAVPNMAIFCNALISCFPVMLLTYFLNHFEMIPVVPIITGI
jgi:hypothetical protein